MVLVGGQPAIRYQLLQQRRSTKLEHQFHSQLSCWKVSPLLLGLLNFLVFANHTLNYHAPQCNCIHLVMLHSSDMYTDQEENHRV